jgi:hypothetical protein
LVPLHPFIVTLFKSADPPLIVEYIAPPFPFVPVHEVNEHWFVTVNLPVPLIVEYIAPPDFDSHELNVI